MNWIFTIAAFAIGVIVGYIIHSLFSRNAENKSNNKELEDTKLEMSQHKQEVSDHLDEHYELLNQLTAQLNAINQHWNDSSTRLGQEPSKHSLQLLVTADKDSAEESEIIETQVVEIKEIDTIITDTEASVDDQAKDLGNHELNEEVVPIEENSASKGEKTS